MKILQVNKLYSPWIGGVEKVVQQIAEGLNRKDDFKIEVLCCQPKGKKKIEEINGVKVFRAASFGIFWGMPISFDFFRLFKELSKEVDIIAFHHPFPLGDLAIFLFPPKRLIVHYHSDIVRQKALSFLVKPFILNTLKKAKKIIVSNPNLIESSSYLRKFKQKCQVIPFGVDLKEIENSLSEQEQRKIKEKYGRFVLFVGRLNYYKGVDYLIEAMKDIDANLVVIGEGKESQNLKLKTENLKLKNRVFFLPHQPREKLINFYGASEVFVLPSIFKSEAFGIVILEAMACGTPVISTELGTGTSWVNQNGKTGFVVPPKNSKSLASAIKTILTQKNLSQQFGLTSQNRVREKFSLNQMIEKSTEVYHNKA